MNRIDWSVKVAKGLDWLNEPLPAWLAVFISTSGISQCIRLPCIVPKCLGVNVLWVTFGVHLHPVCPQNLYVIF